MRLRLFAAWLLGVLPVFLSAQETPPAPPPPPEQFMADYAKLLVAGDREALIRLYSPRGSLALWDGADDFFPLEQTAELYRTQWTRPTAFAWRNLRYQRLHTEVVVVSGGFDWTSADVPNGGRFSYSAVLVFEEGKWRIRSEAEFLQGPLPPKPAGVTPAEGAAGPCVFCEIAAGKRQADSVVYRDDQIAAFLSIGPQNPGHTLIIPVAHAENFLEVPADTMHAMTDFAKRLAETIKRTDLKIEGFTLQMNTGRAAGQSVFHAHLHLIPRFAGDEARQRGDGQSPAEKPGIGPKGEEFGVPPGRNSAQIPANSPADVVGMDVLAPVAAKIRAALGDGALGITRPTFELPAINTEVPLPKIKEICVHYGLHALWAKIEKDPPARPFKSDGCTGWFDDWKGVSLYPAGFLHDLKYWAGYPGEDVERLVADAELMTDVARLLKSTTMAETMFHGVRVGGVEQLKTSFSWGFGRQPMTAK